MIKNFKIYTFITLIASVILAAISTASLFLSYDKEIGYFDVSAITVIRDILIVLAAIVFVFLAFRLEKHKYRALKKPMSLPFQCVSYVCSVIYICAGALIYISSNIANPRLKAIALMLTLISALFFISMTTKKENMGISVALFSIVLALCSTAILIVIYFNMKIPMNSHNKLFSSTVVISSMIAYLLDARIHLDRQHPRFYLLFLMTTGAFGSSFVISRIIYIIATPLTSFEKIPLILENYGFIAVIFASALYSIARISTFYDVNTYKEEIYTGGEDESSIEENEEITDIEK